MNKIIANRSAFVLKDGSIVDLDSSSSVRFEEPAIEYSLEVKHRNHLEVIRSSTVNSNKFNIPLYNAFY